MYASPFVYNGDMKKIVIKIIFIIAIVIYDYFFLAINLSTVGQSDREIFGLDFIVDNPFLVGREKAMTFFFLNIVLIVLVFLCAKNIVDHTSKKH